MKLKRFIFVLALIVTLFSLCGCSNMQIADTTWKFNRAVVKLEDDRVIEGSVQSWLDFDDSDMIQVKIDGITYLTHSSNVVLIAG